MFTTFLVYSFCAKRNIYSQQTSESFLYFLSIIIFVFSFFIKKDFNSKLTN